MFNLLLRSLKSTCHLFVFTVAFCLISGLVSSSYAHAGIEDTLKVNPNDLVKAMQDFRAGLNFAAMYKNPTQALNHVQEVVKHAVKANVIPPEIINAALVNMFSKLGVTTLLVTTAAGVLVFTADNSQACEFGIEESSVADPEVNALLGNTDDK
ncbi:MAG: hypothetical protein A2381_11165 [Bdellovibrionales bacterium RIFOXYB1_FULL_37_110]|nr:MAG: hypothetical protein A2181_01485 [Bdellovibrionales bacterium RIFOXYA1_FULL_38_20]OFZ48600.1 MAG: hypothetical protein A2417_09650 [Bdellovibrionales bacterium RIFOXYC1_FULL_37_79]OFZ58409.1 MAG: hypothetical protein A2381_11165 [Bdellovibrionales bacterium RIFOXYB1_FULL_37_110]OFZ61453.1 MAG: hypothetical protein A2577_00085 [Bdellovibrionales bacterium RIFOXYD1_FULL_36_51]